MINFKETAKNYIQELRTEFINQVVEYIQDEGYENFYICGYKPYFNDGDECIFHLREYGQFSNEEDPDSIDFYDREDHGFYSKFNCDEIEYVMDLPILIVRRDGSFEWRDCDHD